MADLLLSAETDSLTENGLDGIRGPVPGHRASGFGFGSTIAGNNIFLSAAYLNINGTVQSGVHMTYNNPAHRGLAFVVGWLFITLLWIAIAIAVIHRL